MKYAFDLFADYFTGRDNALRRLDARLKLMGSLALILGVLFSQNVIFPLAVLSACLVLFRRLKVPLKLLGLRFLAPCWIVLVLIALKTFLSESPTWFSLALGKWTLHAGREGAWSGLVLGTRVLGATAVLFLLGSVTAAYDFFRTLRWCRLPKELVEIAMLMYRYIFVLLEDAADLWTAQRVRLGYAGFRRSLDSMGNLMGGVLLRSLEQSFRTHEAMTARGYAGEFPLGPLPLLRRDQWLRLSFALGLIGLIFLLLEGRLL